MSTLDVTPEFQTYLEVRDAVRRIKGAHIPDGVAQPSRYWTQELEQIDYLWEASPLIVRKLRDHSFYVTGIRSYDYRDKVGDRRRHFEARLQALRQLDTASLLVAESRALGGFGYEIDGRLVNVDTLKFYEVLIGMQRAGALDAIRAIDRPVVCEIGAGWGGFAYQFKTLFPRTTYVILDFPELFLFSATYLKVVFPEASVLIAGAGDDALPEGWRDADFLFVPNTLAHLVSSLPLDLTVNMVSFQEMADAQVRDYARLAARSGCPLLYSLNRERSPYNHELVSVREALSSQYQLTEVEVLDHDYSSAMKKSPKAGRTLESNGLEYRHYVGRLARPSTRALADGPAHTAVHPVIPGGAAPRVVLGMTLYNNAGHLREALDSLLVQSYADFALVLLDDASSDQTESIAREYQARDPRIRYVRHGERQAMVATWHEVVELAGRECPSAEFFAWVSDHDRWHPAWLERLVAALADDAGVVLAYPITCRITAAGEAVDKGPRLFDTDAFEDRRARWGHFCREGVGAGDMVYGLMRLDALRQAGVFRAVLRPDRLLIAELTLRGRIRQVREVLWFRRQSAMTSITRQRHTLVLPGREPRWFFSPPWLQHAIVLWREYAVPVPQPLPIPRGEWRRMLLLYQVRYGVRHLRKSETSHAVGRAIDGVIWAKKFTRHCARHAVYHTLVGGRFLWARTCRVARRGLYHVLVFTHRIGLRGGSEGMP